MSRTSTTREACNEVAIVPGLSLVAEGGVGLHVTDVILPVARLFLVCTSGNHCVTVPLMK
jgi:hypothetical protein